MQGIFFAFFAILGLWLPIFSALAQDGSAVDPGGTSAGSIATSSAIENIPSASQSRATSTETGASPAPAPVGNASPSTATTSTPQTPSPTAVPISQIPSPSDAPPVPSDNNFGLNTVALLTVAAGLGALGGLAVYSLRSRSSSKNKPDEKENKGRCFDIKKLLEEKLSELTDLKTQLESAAKEKVKESLKGAIAGTPAGELAERIEKGQKEYERLKLLYEKCITNMKATKRVFIVHGWGGYPGEGWFPWLKGELEKQGFKVFVPPLPDAANPRIEKWVPALAEAVGTPDEQTYFVGHSMGCQTIARYLITLPEKQKIGGAVFVAGFFKHLSGLEDDLDVHETDQHWLGAPLDLLKVKLHIPKSVAIFSDSDPWVPLDNQDDFRDKLGSEIVIEHAMGHFSGAEDGVTELPVALKKLLEITE